MWLFLYKVQLISNPLAQKGKYSKFWILNSMLPSSDLSLAQSCRRIVKLKTLLKYIQFQNQSVFWRVLMLLWIFSSIHFFINKFWVCVYVANESNFPAFFKTCVCPWDSSGLLTYTDVNFISYSIRILILIYWPLSSSQHLLASMWKSKDHFQKLVLSLKWCGLWRLNLGHQTWQNVPLPTELFSRLPSLP